MSLNISVKHTHTHTHAHAHTVTLLMEMEEQEVKDMKCLWQELQENRRVLREDFKDWNSKNNLRALCQFSFSDDFLLHTPWWVILSAGSFSYSPMMLYMGSLSKSYTPCAGLCREHLLHTPMLVYMGSFSYMPCAGYMWSFSYMPSAGLRVEFLLHTPCWLLSLGSFSHKVYAGFLMQQISSLQNKKKKM